MCGGGGGSPDPVWYTALDGWKSQDPNKIADRNRMVQLSSALGRPELTTFRDWASNLSGDTKAAWENYNGQGLTAADYRSEQRINEQTTQAEAAEQQRKDSIVQSRAAIDQQLGTFDDNYYNDLQKTVMDYYQPQLDDQFKNAGQQTTYKLARQGLLKSDEAAKERAKLQSAYDVQRSGITNKAADAASQAREGVSSAKSNLYNYADLAADPAAVNSQLANETARLNAQAPSLTPMGQVFSDYITPVVQQIGSGLIAESQGYKGYNTGLFNSGKSSAVNVSR